MKGFLQELKERWREWRDPMYCPKCGTCGYIGCCGVDDWLEKHVRGKTNCLYE